MTFVDGTCDGPKLEETQQPHAAIPSGDNCVANPSLEEPSSINTEVPIPEEPPIHPDHRQDQLPLEDFPPYHTSSPVRPPSDKYPTLSLREASLMRRFIQNIAPWVSISGSLFESVLDLIPLGGHLRSLVTLHHNHSAPGFAGPNGIQGSFGSCGAS